MLAWELGWQGRHFIAGASRLAADDADSASMGNKPARYNDEGFTPPLDERGAASFTLALNL